MSDLEYLLDKCVEKLQGQPRQGQKQMVELVGEAIDCYKPALVEAGTGTGKSLGYLVPAVAKTHLGKIIVISTATLALQRQIFEKDIPIVSQVFKEEYGYKPRVTVLKGWSNYLCLKKLNGEYHQEEIFPEESSESSTDSSQAENADKNNSSKDKEDLSPRAKEFLRVSQWAKETKTGDRDELVPGVKQEIWDMVSTTTTECTNAKCPFYSQCFPVEARKKASESDIVITNHSILGIHTQNSLLPNYDVLIVDEAHELEKSVVSQATATINVIVLNNVVQKLVACDIEDEYLKKTITNLAIQLTQIEEGWLKNGLSQQIQDNLILIHTSFKKLSREVNTKEKAEDKKSRRLEKILIAKSYLQEIITTLENFIDFSKDTKVMWCVHAKDDKYVNINLAPLSVAKSIYECLVKDKSAIFTSATLTVNKNFKQISRALGVEENYSSDIVPSPFNYEKQGILYIASDLPAPTTNGISQESLQRLVQLLKASSGGALCLFSSYLAAEKACEYVRENTDLNIYLQGDEQLPNLINNFRNDIDSCLFGTISLWQGVDVRGKTLRLVTIDRIPFARPNDPVHQAKCDLYERMGLNPFMNVTLPNAALLLAQGTGRLIREVTDKGVVAVLDSRLVKSKYGAILRASIPAFWYSDNLEVVCNSLKNLSELDY